MAALLGGHRHPVATWLQVYEGGGLERLLAYHVPGPTQGRRIPAAALADRQQRLADPKGFASYGQIQAYLAEQHQVPLAYSTVHALVRYELKAKPKAPRRSHEKKPVAIVQFQRELPTLFVTSAKPAQQGGLTAVKVVAQDETRIGWWPIVPHRLTAWGVQPITPVGHRFDNFFLVGAVEALTGESFFLELPPSTPRAFNWGWRDLHTLSLTV